MKSLLLFSFFTIFIVGCANNQTPKKKYEKDYILCLNKDSSFSLKKEIELFRVKPNNFPFRHEFINCDISYSDVELRVNSSSMGEFYNPIKVDKNTNCKSFIEIYEDNSFIYKIVEFDKLKEQIKDGVKYEVPTFKEYKISKPINLNNCISLKEVQN